MSVEDGVSKTPSGKLVTGLGDPEVPDKIEALASMDPGSLCILTGGKSIFSKRMDQYWGKRGRRRLRP